MIKAPAYGSWQRFSSKQFRTLASKDFWKGCPIYSSMKFDLSLLLKHLTIYLVTSLSNIILMASMYF